jgi:uncharacterized membrane protein
MFEILLLLMFGVFFAFTSMLTKVRGAVWSKDGTEYTRNEQPGTFWFAVVSFMIGSVTCLLIAGIKYLKYVSIHH